MKKYLALLAVAVLALGSTSAQADPIHWVLDHVFSGDPAPGRAVDVTLATLDNGADDDTVLLTIVPSVGSGEFVSKLYLNFTDDLLPRTSLDIADYPDPPSYTDYIFTLGDNDQNADGGAGFYFDIFLDLALPGEDRLTDGETAQFEFTYPGGLSESAFDYPTSLGLYAAAHIQGIGVPGTNETRSVWVTEGGNGEVPEASTLMLFGTGLSGLLFYVRKKGLIKL